MGERCEHGQLIACSLCLAMARAEAIREAGPPPIRVGDFVAITTDWGVTIGWGTVKQLYHGAGDVPMATVVNPDVGVQSFKRSRLHPVLDDPEEIEAWLAT